MRSGPTIFTRRELMGMGIAGFGASLVSGCQALQGVTGTQDAPLIDPILTTRVSAPKGTARLGLSVPISTPSGEAFLYVPAGYQASSPAPFVLMLHDEGSTAYAAISLLQPHADAAGLVLLSVDSSAATWDILAAGQYGPDVAFINAALAAAFDQVSVDPARVTVEGFSDGASYALALGLTNGGLFSRVISFSAAYIAPYTPSGKPAFFMSQGVSDAVFDITQSGDFIDRKLVAAGYAVDYVRFDGAHEVPDSVVQQAIAWLAA